MGDLDREGRDELHYAARDGDIVAVEARLNAGVDVNLPENRSHYTPLHSAVDTGKAAVAAFLLDAGADIEARTKIGYTPLHLAVNRWRLAPDGSVIKLLLDRGADTSATDVNGFTAIHAAQGQNRFPPELYELLTQ